MSNRLSSAVVLAAGAASRFGQPKQLLDWFGKPLIRAVADSCAKAGASEVICVLGHRSREIIPILKDGQIKTVLNERHVTSKAMSVRTGIRACSANSETILVIGADQPRPVRMLAPLVGKPWKGDSKIRVPLYEGTAGHPIAFKSVLRSELERVDDDDQGLRRVVNKYRAAAEYVEVGDAAFDININAPSDYKEALHIWASENPF